METIGRVEDVGNLGFALTPGFVFQPVIWLGLGFRG